MKTLILIPAYNEAENIYATVTGARRHLPGADILVVDDGSLDATGDFAMEAGVSYLAVHKRNLSYGEALRTGYGFALDGHYQCVIQMDADGQHDPRYLPLFRSVIDSGWGAVIGSRFLGRPGYHVPICRRIGMELFAHIARKKTGLNLTDTTSGYRAYSNLATAVVLCGTWEYPDANLLIYLHDMDIKITEIPVTMHGNKRGKSMHSGMEPVYYVARTLFSLATGRG